MTNNGTIINVNKFHRPIPIVKVDEQRRIVSGFATLDNIDLVGDRILTEASLRAFEKFRGNIREQHSNIAAGRLLSYGIQKVFDRTTNAVFDGIFVRAYISKGAEPTWLKVLDGTLNGFSVGALINDDELVIDDSGNPIRVIKDYDLLELSLVDNPANPLANLVSIEKAMVMFDQIADNLEGENVEESMEAVEPVVEVGVEPVVEVVEPVVEVVEEPVVEPAAPVVEPDPEPVEAKVSDAEILSAAIAELKQLMESQSTLSESVNEIAKAITAMTSRLSEVDSKVGVVQDNVTKFDQRVSDVEKFTAGRKSVDLGEVTQEKKTTQKSVWGGRFLATSDL